MAVGAECSVPLITRGAAPKLALARQGLSALVSVTFGPSGQRRVTDTVCCMTYVIGRECVDIADMSCVQECPVDCIYQGDRALYINPQECVDCGACKLICRVNAIYYDDDLPEDQIVHHADNAAFFEEVLPGRDTPLGSPGGAALVGRVGVDTPLISALPVRN